MKKYSLVVVLISFYACISPENRPYIQEVNQSNELAFDKVWLSHEHILVDFIGADSIHSKAWDHDTILKELLPYLLELKEFNVSYFVDATPNYLGRDVLLLEKITKITGLRIITNTGLYGAYNNKYIPQYAFGLSAEELAKMWVNEFKHGINKTSIKPGFIKIGVDNADTLHPMHEKLVRAAALTHLETGLTIASHTGPANGLWPQLDLLKEMGVSPEAFIWVHAYWEGDNQSLIKAAEAGFWISLDGLAWDLENHIDKLLFAKENGILDKVLISHDAGWYDPQKVDQDIRPYTNLFTKLFPALISNGFTEEELNLLMCINPAKAFAIRIKPTVENLP